MFLFRWLSNILAPIGLILAILIIYFAFFPLLSKSQPKLTLNKVLSCNPQTYQDVTKYLTDEELLKLKNQLGAASPIELVNEFAFGSVTESLAKPMGSKTRLEITYCNVDNEQADALSSVQNYLKTQDKLFTYSSLEDFIDKVNSVPFAKISNFDIKVPSTFARTTYCSKPTSNADFYLFSVIPGAITKSTVIMFNMSFEDNSDAKNYYKYSGNIIKSAQYMKSKLYCNG